MSVILGIEVGTQSVKALLLDSRNGETAAAGQDYDISVPAADHAEQDPETWWEAVRAVLRKLRDKRPDYFDAISCIGLTGQMHGLVTLDARRKPVMPAIIWVDQRSKKQADELNGMFGQERIGRTLHNRISTGFAFPSLLWIKQERPDAYDNIHTICCPKDYIRMKLTGELAGEVTDASSTTAFDIGKRAWAYDMIAACGLREDIFPVCHESDEIAGRVTRSAARQTGVRAGAEVIYGSGDLSALLLGNGAYTSDVLVANIGTGGIVGTYAGEDVYDKQLRMHTFCNVVNHAYLVFGAILAGGLSMRWLKNQVLKSKSYDAMTALAAEVPAASEGVVFLPYLGGERTPHMDHNATGLFFGLKLGHDRRHMIRAVMEGVVYALKDCAAILEDIGVSSEQVTASGGGARSELWLQMQADIFGKEVAVTRTVEQAGLGACIMAGIACGIYADEKEACQNLVRIEEKRYFPNRDLADAYERGYRLYRSLYQANRELMAGYAGGD
jgi:xylulokinase